MFEQGVLHFFIFMGNKLSDRALHNACQTLSHDRF
jgi:hypothetical protein